MEELIEKVAELKQELNNVPCIIELKKLNQELKKDKELLSLIEDYNYTKDERTREKIISNSLYRNYQHQEAELNFLILEINNELKKITGKGKCHNENN